MFNCYTFDKYFLWLIQKELLKIVTTVHDCLITRTPNLQDINISRIINVDSHLLLIFVVIGIFIKFIVFGDVFRENLIKLYQNKKRPNVCWDALYLNPFLLQANN